MTANQATSVGTGYRCSVCGTWVNFGQYHGCGGTPSYPLPTIDQQAAALHRIAAALELIAARLDALTTGGSAAGSST